MVKFKVLMIGIMVVLMVGGVIGQVKINDGDNGGGVLNILKNLFSFSWLFTENDRGYGYGICIKNSDCPKEKILKRKYCVGSTVYEDIENNMCIKRGGVGICELRVTNKIIKDCNKNKNQPHCSEGKCICSCEKLLSYKMNENVKKKFEELIKKLKEEGCSADVKEVETENFIVKSPEGYADCIAKFLEFHRYRIAKEYLGKELEKWDKKIIVKVYSLISLSETGSYYRDSMNLIGTLNTLFLHVIPHELIHAVIDKDLNSDLRKDYKHSFEEGIAESSLLTPYGNLFNQYDLLVENLIQKNQILGVGGPFETTKYPFAFSELAVTQIYSMVEFLLSLDPSPQNRLKLMNFYKEFIKTKDFEGALKKYYGFDNIEEFQEEWINFFKKQYKNKCNIVFCESENNYREDISNAIILKE